MREDAKPVSFQKAGQPIVVPLKRLYNGVHKGTGEPREGDLGVSEATLHLWIRQGRFPKTFTIGRQRFVMQSDLDAWLEDQRSKPETRSIKAAA
jgi:excisionase family DNA binding protein